MGRAVTEKSPEDNKGKKQKKVDIQEAANGFIVNTHEYEYDYGGKPKVYRSAEEVGKAVEKFLND